MPPCGRTGTGPITAVRIATAGQNSPLAAFIDTNDGRVFAKGRPSDHRRVVTQTREAAIAPFVSDISPALLWHFDEAGWNVLGYQYAPGRHADYTPGSPDLDRLVQLMSALSKIKVPDGHRPFKRADDRWKPYLDDPESAAVFAGPVLTHSDWTPDNVLISAHRAWLIDWAWPTLGAGWIASRHGAPIDPWYSTGNNNAGIYGPLAWMVVVCLGRPIL